MRRLSSGDLRGLGWLSWELCQAREHRGTAVPLTLGCPCATAARPRLPSGPVCAPSVRGLHVLPTERSQGEVWTRPGRPLHALGHGKAVSLQLARRGLRRIGASDPSNASVCGRLASAWLCDPSGAGRWPSTREVWECDTVTQGRRLLGVVGMEGTGGWLWCSSLWATVGGDRHRHESAPLLLSDGRPSGDPVPPLLLGVLLPCVPESPQRWEGAPGHLAEGGSARNPQWSRPAGWPRVTEPITGMGTRRPHCCHTIIYRMMED